VITRETVAQVSQLTSTEWPIISLFLRIDKERIDEDFTIRLRNLVRAAEDAIDDRFSHEQQEALRADVERIQEFIRDNSDQYGRAIAVVACSPADIWQVYDVPTEVETSVSIGPTANAAPLIRVLEQLEPFCTCLIARDQARIFYGQLGQFEELESMRDDMVPGQHEQGGWSQQRFERHIEEHVRSHFKRVADALSAIAQERPYRFLVLGGPEEVVSGFSDLLHQYVKERHVGTIRANQDAGQNEVEQSSLEVIGRWRMGEKERVLDVLRGEVLSDDMGVSGLERTIEALQNGQIMTLVIDSTFRHPGAVCTQCLSVQPPSSGDGQDCVYCGGELRHVENIVDEIVVRAFQQDAKIIYLDVPELQQALGQLGHIGAILRFTLTPAEDKPSS
jgi:peptide chain release factor subunit 1